MRHLKLIRTIMAVTLLAWGLLFYSSVQAITVTFTPATKDVGAKMWPVLSYYDDDDYNSGDYESGESGDSEDSWDYESGDYDGGGDY
jgi:hypothetical protein